jgi:chromosome segregation ATPase
LHAAHHLRARNLLAAIMETMSWTDERLDNFAAETARRFDTFEARVDERFARVDERFDDVNRRLDGIDRRLERFEDRLDDLGRTIQRTMLQLGGGMIATFALGLIGVIVTHA